MFQVTTTGDHEMDFSGDASKYHHGSGRIGKRRRMM